MQAIRSTPMFRATLLTLLFGLLLAAPVRAQHTVLHSFNGDAGEGYNPLGSLLQSGSTLYGMSISGGRADYGTIFRIRTDGTGFSTLHSFNDGSVSGDGYEPYYGSLIQSGSTLYGMTPSGGRYSGGTIFQIGTDGTSYGLLHSFSDADGVGPYGSLLQSGSTLYGMTAVGGASGVGTIFRIGTGGTGLSVLHSFSGEEGAHPHGSLIQSGSTLYGMTTGGSGSPGTIFQIGTDGTGFRVLHSFTDPDGFNPYGSLIQSGSTLYGMTNRGGPNSPDARGTVFQIGTDGTGFSVLHSFSDADGYGDDGLNPYGSLLLSGSTLFGMATGADGGSGPPGTIFEIGTDGTGFRVLHSFSGPDRGYPFGSLIQSGSSLYGMTTVGGEFPYGTVFSLVVPEPSSLALLILVVPFVMGQRICHSSKYGSDIT